MKKALALLALVLSLPQADACHVGVSVAAPVTYALPSFTIPSFAVPVAVPTFAVPTFAVAAPAVSYAAPAFAPAVSYGAAATFAAPVSYGATFAAPAAAVSYGAVGSSYFSPSFAVSNGYGAVGAVAHGSVAVRSRAFAVGVNVNRVNTFRSVAVVRPGVRGVAVNVNSFRGPRTAVAVNVGRPAAFRGAQVSVRRGLFGSTVIRTR